MNKLTLWALSAAALPTAAASVAPYAKFGDGLLSKTRPTGWIGEFCARQRSGLTGHPEALSYPYDTCLWAGEIARMGSHGSGWWRYEQTGYYTDGLLKLGYALGDKELIAKGEAGVDYTLAHASEDGYLGNPCLWDAKKFKLDPACTMWPMAVYFRVMKAKYDAAPDPRIPAALTKYYLNYDAEAVARGRNLVSVEGMLWCHSLNGDKRLLDLAEAAWNLSAPQWGVCDDIISPQTCRSDEPLYVHGVTYCELMKVPMLLAAHTGKKEYLDQAVNIERKLVRDHLLPDGCPSSVEETRGNSVHWGHETCDIADFAWSVGYALELTGDAKYADEIERCVFNAGLGAVTKDFKALQYFSNCNQFLARGDSDHNIHHYGSTWMQYRPTHETECCAGSVHRIMPNYVSRMWMTDKSGDPVAALYGPSEVDYGFATIREETGYPFDGRITFTFSKTEGREFAFNYRVPGWCRGAKVTVNGQALAADEIPAAGTFGAIRRAFRDGDVVELDFPMGVRFERLPSRVNVVKDVVIYKTLVLEGPERSQGTVVLRGPLLFAYPIETTVTTDEKVYENMNGKRSANPDFPCLDMQPAGPFNFALAAHEAKVVKTGARGYPLGLSAVPVAIEVPARRIDWPLFKDRFTPDMPRKVVPVADRDETIRLVPYGATCLRLSVFPELAGVAAAASTKANTVEATIETSLGTIELELDAAKAPLTVTNFMAYAKAGHYDGTVFHRVIDGFMIQGGGFTAEMRQKETRAPVRNEAANGLKNRRGTIAMARTMVVDSATSQFFINLKDNGFLDYRGPDPRTFGYAVFGHVTKGMDVVDKIAKVQTGNRGFHQNVPVEPVVIKAVSIK